MSPKDTSQQVSVTELKALLGTSLYTETIEHFISQTGLSKPEVESQLIECLRYLYLVSRYPEQLSGLFLPVEQSIDEIWHYLILQTREYRAFCEISLPGQRFIEHRSLSYEGYQQTLSREQLIEQSLRWLPLYCRTFGPFDEHALPHWTMPRFLRVEMGLSLNEIASLSLDKAA